MSAARRFPSIAALTDPDALASLFGPVEAVTRAPLSTPGYTAALIERVTLRLRDGVPLSLVLKLVRLEEDWTARRTDDSLGREAAVLEESALAAVWDHVACPYLAFARESAAIGLLSRDLTPHLFPDERRPLHEEQEDRLLETLASLHARFWGSAALTLPWLAEPAGLACMLDAQLAGEPGPLERLLPALRERVPRGWKHALPLLGPRGAAWMTMPRHALARAWEDLPRTLVHGDAKVANFALDPEGRVYAFDWALVGAAPVSADLGWYLAVNASRLARSKEEVAARYRSLLSARLPAPVDDDLWRALFDAAVVFGARTLLWSKADHLDSGGAAARGRVGLVAREPRGVCNSRLGIPDCARPGERFMMRPVARGKESP